MTIIPLCNFTLLTVVQERGVANGIKQAHEIAKAVAEITGENPNGVYVELRHGTYAYNVFANGAVSPIKSKKKKE